MSEIAPKKPNDDTCLWMPLMLSLFKELVPRLEPIPPEYRLRLYRAIETVLYKKPEEKE